MRRSTTTKRSADARQARAGSRKKRGRRPRQPTLVPQTVEYALRAAAYLATRPDGQALAADLLASETGIPVHYLSKVLRRLVEAEILVGQKGHGGGFALARAKGDIRMADILDAVGFLPRPATCAFGWGTCDPERPCPLHPVWSRVTEAFQTWAAGATLADVGPWLPAKKRRNV